ncbi:MAG: hypothetical protein H6730_24905 [Deltaproteobacteria bacterium]|nr:hypothetical protein [Deltaproteobacteria bacterium]
MKVVMDGAWCPYTVTCEVLAPSALLAVSMKVVEVVVTGIWMLLVPWAPSYSTVVPRVTRTVSAPRTFQLRVVLPPIAAGLGAAPKPRIAGAAGFTVTVAAKLALPAGLKAVSVYSVVAAGSTEIMPVRLVDTVVVPAAVVISMRSALLAAQESTEAWPRITVVGLARKLSIVAPMVPFTVTVTESVPAPWALVATRV